MNQQVNLRALKKHRSIQNAFYEVASLTPFEKIRVDQIITFAHIPAARFYQSYDNIQDLINYCRRELIQNLNDEIHQKTFTKDNHSNELIQLNINRLLGYIKNHQLEFKVMLDNDSSNVLKEYLKQSIKLAIMDNYEINSSLSQSTHLYIAEMFAAIIIKWINHHCHETVAELATLIIHLHQSMMVG